MRGGTDPEDDSALDASILRRLLGRRRRVGRVLEIHPELDSTNLEAARRCETRPVYDLDGLVLVADHQTRGKGRRGDPWHSRPGGGLCLTAVFHTSLSGAALSYLSVVAGVAVVRAVDRLSGPTLSLKWPNDLHIGKRKVGGILMELAGGDSATPLALLGIGINTHLRRDEFPAELSSTATSLLIAAEESGRRVPSRTDLLGILLQEIERGLEEAEAGTTSRLARIWRQRSLLLGRRVRIETGGEIIEGRVVDLPFPPSLVLQTDRGEKREIRGEWAHRVRLVE